MVANPARGQLNREKKYREKKYREKEYFSVRVRA